MRQYGSGRGASPEEVPRIPQAILRTLKDPVRARFDDFVLDSSSRQVTRAGRPVPLSPKGFDLLALLIEQRPNVVTKADILDHVWADAPAAADGNLTVVIAEVRRALGDDPQHPQYIRTVHRFGYAFCGDAVDDPVAARVASRSDATSQRQLVRPANGPHPADQTADRPADRDAAPPAHVPAGKVPETRALLTWGDQVRRLEDGEHVVGRDPACGVWLDVAGVSRRHARLVVHGDQATLEDLGSTNGTLVDDVPVQGQQRLQDGQRIHFGPLEVRFRFYSGAVKTEKVRK